MRKWASVTAVLLAVAFPAVALADGPPEIYSDFAEDGALSCGHSRSALKEVLNDASIHQYGDPLTLIGLKLAVRQQLAGGCRSRRSDRPLSFFTPADTEVPPSGSTESSANSTKSSTGEAKRSRIRTQGQLVPPPPAAAGVATGGQQNGRMVLLGVVLLLVVLGSGGWAARRALSD
jgi:hypothetical protein